MTASISFITSTSQAAAASVGSGAAGAVLRIIRAPRLGAGDHRPGLSRIDLELQHQGRLRPQQSVVELAGPQFAVGAAGDDDLVGTAVVDADHGAGGAAVHWEDGA